jgi:hypothetical protein
LGSGIRVGVVDGSHDLAVGLDRYANDPLIAAFIAAGQVNQHFAAGSEAGVERSVAVNAQHSRNKIELSS